jgi:hypothetical protein
VHYWGYNAAPAGGRLNTADAGYQFRHESHYINGSEGTSFEFHLPELTTSAGDPKRLYSIYANKATGAAIHELTAKDFKIYDHASGLAWLDAVIITGASNKGSGTFNLYNVNDDINPTAITLAHSGTGATNLNYSQLIGTGTGLNITVTGVGAQAANTNVKFSANKLYLNSALSTYYDAVNDRITMNSGTPTSKLDLTGANGYTQLRLRTSYTPTSSSDTNGATGDFAWDDSFVYIKTSAGWKRATLSTF